MLVLPGNSRWVSEIDWSGKGGYNGASDEQFTVDGVEAGIFRSHGPLTFLKVLYLFDILIWLF